MAEGGVRTEETPKLWVFLKKKDGTDLDMSEQAELQCSSMSSGGHILNKPVHCVDCGHRFCQSCWDSLSQKDKQHGEDVHCPKCEQVLDEPYVQPDFAVQKLLDNIQLMIPKVKSTEAESEQSQKDMVESLAVQLKEARTEIETMSAEIKEYLETLQTLHRKEAEIKELKKTIEDYEKRFHEQVPASVRDQHIRPRYGTICIILDQFASQRENAQKEPMEYFESEPFYTKEKGEKGAMMFTRVYYSSTATNKREYLMIEFGTLPGQYDDDLKWPLNSKDRFKIEVKVIDKRENHPKHFTDAYHPDPNDAAARRITDGKPRLFKGALRIPYSELDDKFLHDFFHGDELTIVLTCTKYERCARKLPESQPIESEQCITPVFFS